MNTPKSAARLSSSYPSPGELAHYEREARRLRAEFVANSVASLLIALDRFTRRITCRIAARLFGSDCNVPVR